MFYGMIKNHPWAGDNKRTAAALTQLFLRRNGFRMVAAVHDLVALVLTGESGSRRVEEVAAWPRSNTFPS